MIERETFKKNRKEIGTPHVLQEVMLSRVHGTLLGCEKLSLFQV
jgi:hypothetical protein